MVAAQKSIESLNFTIIKMRRWLFFLVILALIALTALFVLGEPLLAILLAISAGLVWAQAHKRPPHVQFEVAPTHVLVNDDLYNSHDIKSFWIYYIKAYSKYTYSRTDR